MPDNDINSYTLSDYDCTYGSLRIPERAKRSYDDTQIFNDDFKKYICDDFQKYKSCTYSKGDKVPVVFVHHYNDQSVEYVIDDGYFVKFKRPYMKMDSTIGIIRINEYPGIVFTYFPMNNVMRIDDKGTIMAFDLIGFCGLLYYVDHRFDIFNQKQFIELNNVTVNYKLR